MYRAYLISNLQQRTCTLTSDSLPTYGNKPNNTANRVHANDRQLTQGQRQLRQGLYILFYSSSDQNYLEETLAIRCRHPRIYLAEEIPDISSCFETCNRQRR